MFDRFTDRSRKSMALARKHALALGDPRRDSRVAAGA